MRLRNIPGAKDAIEESIYVIQNPQENKGNWNKVFPQNQPVHLEVGMGKGRFLMDMAKLHPEINYIGIEIEYPYFFWSGYVRYIDNVYVVMIF